MLLLPLSTPKPVCSVFFPDQQYCLSGKEQSLGLEPKFILGVHLPQEKVVYL